MHKLSSNDSIRILLVDAQQDDVKRIETAFSNTDVEPSIHNIHDGDVALDFLRTCAESSSKKFPNLLLVAMELPGCSGLELLETIRNESNLQHLPVIILTRSESCAEISRLYDAYANAVLLKPGDFDGFVAIAEAVNRFWCQRAHLPPIGV